MPNSVFQALSQDKIDTFRKTFTQLSKELFTDTNKQKLRHPGEYGAYRERACVDFLTMYLPSYLQIGNGFLMNKNESVSTQCDLVIYDPQYTPLVEDNAKRRFFPVETVVGVGEVKSTLSKSKFYDALIKLAHIKQLRKIDTQGIMRRANPILFEEHGHHYDQMMTFLICEKLDFDLKHITSEVAKYYDKETIPIEYRHNMVLSIEDGVLCYKNQLISHDVAWMYPWTRNKRMGNRFVSPGENNRNHFGIFTSYLFTICAKSTIYFPAIQDYDTPPSMGKYEDEIGYEELAQRVEQTLQAANKEA